MYSINHENCYLFQTLASREKEVEELKTKIRQLDEMWNSKCSELESKFDESVKKESEYLKRSDENKSTIDNLSQKKEELEEELKRLSSQLEECHVRYSEKDSQEESLRNEVQLLLTDKKKLEVQLDETLVTLQGKEMQFTKVIENLKNELKSSEIKYLDEIKQLREEETSQRYVNIILYVFISG